VFAKIMNAIKKLFGKAKAQLARPFAALATEWERLAPRERRLITTLAGVLTLLVLLTSGFLFVGSLRDLKVSNDEMREALLAMNDNRDEYLDARSRQAAQDARIGSGAPQLAADLEVAAREVGIQIPETNERPATPVGKRYLEHNVDIKLRQVDLQALSKFLAKLETGGRLIVVTRMGVKRGFADGSKLNVELTATAYERVKDDGAGRGTRRPRAREERP
jgi:general secretion pathway protein M